jgi:multicomponent Na+:H+ antiporter subunit E
VTGSSRKQTRRQYLRQLPYALWLIVLWLALWGQLSVLAVLTGMIIAFLVVRVFYVPRAEAPGRFNP